MGASAVLGGAGQDRQCWTLQLQEGAARHQERTVCGKFIQVLSHLLKVFKAHVVNRCCIRVNVVKVLL